MLEKIFSKPGKVKYSNIHLLAVLIGSLYRYHQDFVIVVIDNLLENITLGLEQNDFKFNQRRLAEVKYLGELYNYKMVDSPLIFDTLYRMVTLGHSEYWRLWNLHFRTNFRLRAEHRLERDSTPSTCPMTFSEYVLCALFLTRAAYALTVAPPRRSSISS